MARLPDYLDPLFTAEEMRAADRYAIERHGVASLDLMEHAGAGLARTVADVAPRGPVRVVAGGGHNGADGLVAARLLRAQGREVTVHAVVPMDDLRGDPRVALDRLTGEPPVPFAPAALEGAAVLVDAMLGTGFEGVAHEPAAGAIAALNASPAPTVAADVPSGLDASTGEAEGPVVRAAVTATNHAPKVGLHVGVGADCAGRVVVNDIGIPGGGPSGSTAGLIVRPPGDAEAVAVPGTPVLALTADELALRLRTTPEDVERRPLRAVRAAAETLDAVVVLATGRPLVAAPAGLVAVGSKEAPSDLRARLAPARDPFAAAVAALAQGAA